MYYFFEFFFQDFPEILNLIPTSNVYEKSIKTFMLQNFEMSLE